MAFRKRAFVNLVILTVAFTEVATWTIDLPEVRKILFEKTEKYKKYNKNEYEDYLNSDQKFYSNIEGNSKHHSEDYKHEHHVEENDKYAHNYDYDPSYMEKKVHDIVRDGSSYLEGLRLSLEDYNTLLESCNRRNTSAQNSTSTNSTAWRPQYDPPSSPFPSPPNSSVPMMDFQNYYTSASAIRNSSESRRPTLRGRNNRRMTCEEATEASEQVRRYAELAMWATRRLQDMAYAKKYQKSDEQEENELVLKLAWFLDRLAYLSGYEPEYKEKYEPRGTKSTPTTSPTPPTLVPSSFELTMEMMDCLKRNSSEPATIRCRYPLELPDMMKQIINGGTTESSRPSDIIGVIPMNSPDNAANAASELLVTADNSFPNSFPASQITKRSVDYTYYYPAKPLHALSYPVPIVKLIKHRLSNIKSVVKNIVERRLSHLAEKTEEKHHFDKRSIDETNVQSSNYINPVSSNPKIAKSVEKRPFVVSSPLLHYPVSDVSIINTKSFRKRSVDGRRETFNHMKGLLNFKYVKKVLRPIKKFQQSLASAKLMKRDSKDPVSKLKSVQKRYTHDPFSKLANYYIKYKVWDNSNPMYQKKNFNKKPGTFDVKNDLTELKTIHKRSLFKKKVTHLHVPKPLQIVRTLHGHRLDNIQKSKLLLHLQKLHNFKHNKKTEKLHKISKRSSYYERMYLPRIPMDPQGDISYYVKNKEGVNYNPSLVQAALVRAGLEQVFQTGNIEIVRRFGSNYNPLNPAPFYTGILATLADA